MTQNVMEAARELAWSRIQKAEETLRDATHYQVMDIDIIMINARQLLETVASMKNFLFNMEQLLATVEIGDTEP